MEQKLACYKLNGRVLLGDKVGYVSPEAAGAQCKKKARRAWVVKLLVKQVELQMTLVMLTKVMNKDMSNCETPRRHLHHPQTRHLRHV